MLASNLEAAVQYTFVILTLFSEWTLIFDQWVLTTTIPFLPARKYTRRQRYVYTAVTSALYALLQPSAYLLLNSLSDHATFFMLIFHFEHMFAIGATFMWQSDFMGRMKKRHRELCLAIDGDEKKESEHDEKGPKKSESEKTDLEAAPSPAPASTADDDDVSHKFCPNHTLTLEYRLIPIIPLVSAAFCNAALVYYTQWLFTDDSKGGRQKSTFCWSVLVSLSVVYFAVGKLVGTLWQKSMSLSSKLQKDAAAEHGERIGAEVTVGRLLNLLVLIVIRAGVRIMCGLDPFLLATWGQEGGQGPRLRSSIQIPDFTSNPDIEIERTHFVDRMLLKVWNMVPTWIWPVCSVVLCLYSGQQRLREFLQQRQEKQRKDLGKSADLAHSSNAHLDASRSEDSTRED